MRCDATKLHWLRCAKADRECEGYGFEYVALSSHPGLVQDLVTSSLQALRRQKSKCTINQPLVSDSTTRVADKLVKSGGDPLHVASIADVGSTIRSLARSAVLLAATGFQRFEHEDDLQLLIEKRGGIVP